MAFSNEEQREYVELVIVKQISVSPEEAKDLADKLSPEQFTRLHDAARAGHMHVCCEVLAECETEAPAAEPESDEADEHPAKKRKRH